MYLIAMLRGMHCAIYRDVRYSYSRRKNRFSSVNEGGEGVSLESKSTCPSYLWFALSGPLPTGRLTPAQILLLSAVSHIALGFCPVPVALRGQESASLMVGIFLHGSVTCALTIHLDTPVPDNHLSHRPRFHEGSHLHVCFYLLRVMAHSLWDISHKVETSEILLGFSPGGC
ncbi:hypothetical protein BDZ97DRAFT_1144763 [Flammula alnicola]|nr:hypothetical protein BDZ97DRAFT_1144763 [Flammula alnicola]